MTAPLDVTLETAIALARLAGENAGRISQVEIFDGLEEALEGDELDRGARWDITDALPDVDDALRSVLVDAFKEGYYNTVHAIP